VSAGVDLDRFVFKRKNVENKNGKFRILYIGAFSPAYDFDQVMKAAELLASFSDVEFVVQGGGELADALTSKVRMMMLRNVKIVEKIVRREEVAGILGDADVLLLPLSGVGSIELGISSKLYEYQASGKPILCCSSGQPARYISETKSGVVVDPGDYKTLAKSVLYLKENPSVAEELGESGRRYVENHMSIQKIGQRMKRVLESVQIAGKGL
jgi:glycosyltransferase involved in cell wall biosynthesis